MESTMMDHQTIVKLILYDYQLQCFSYLAVNCPCVNFIFNISDKPVKHIVSILGNTKGGKNIVESHTFTTHIV